MPSWTIADSAAGAPLWACASIKLAPTSANRTNLYEDAVADMLLAGVETAKKHNISICSSC